MACGEFDTDNRSETSNDLGIQIASLGIKDSMSVSFYEVPDHGMVTVVKGSRGTSFLDEPRLESQSVTDVYRALTGEEPPVELVAATQRLADASVATKTMTVQTSDFGRGITQDLPSGSIDTFAAPNTSWFVTNFCNGLNTEYDAMWCPTNAYSWAHSGWGPVQKFYETCGTTADVAGTLWLEIWHGSWQPYPDGQPRPLAVGLRLGLGRGTVPFGN